MSGYIPLSGTNALSGSIIPSTNTSYYLGSANYRFSEGYFGNLWTNGLFGNLDSGIDINYQVGANLILRGKNRPSEAGIFWLVADDGSNSSRMMGSPDGTLTWGSKNIAMTEDTIPRGGGAVLSGSSFSRTVNNSELQINGGTGWGQGASIALGGKDKTGNTGAVYMHARDATSYNQIEVWPNGNVIQNLNGGTIKHVAMAEDVVPRSGGSVLSGNGYFKTTNDSFLVIGAGSNAGDGATIVFYGATMPSNEGNLVLRPNNGTVVVNMRLQPDGTWTWGGTAVQLVSDQRLKQQISEIDDKLLDAWEDVELVQFKYNDAVNQKGDNARLHTGYVVQQIDTACKSHNVDISDYGLYCHEEYPEETEEVEVEQDDGTIKKETKAIREASEHYSLRYTETLVVECAYLRREISRLKEELNQLKAK